MMISLKRRKELEKLGFKSLRDKNGKLYKNLEPEGVSQCQCDCMKMTCSHCFMSGLQKPWCTNCHKDFNSGTCGCANPKQYIKEGWKDNTKHIVKHTPEEKEIIYGWIDKHDRILKRAINSFDKIWEEKNCSDCGKTFTIRGGRIKTCKKCTMKILNDSDQYSEEN